MNEMMMFWLIILIVAIVAEVLTMGLTTIWFAGGALVAILTTVVRGPVWLQVVLFFLVSFLLLFFTRPIAVKYFNKDRVKTNVESLMGKQAIVTSEINNLQGIGQVTVGSQEWSARSREERGSIPVGTVVNILAVSGVKLIVEPDKQMQQIMDSGASIPEPMSVSEIEEMEASQTEKQ